MTEITIMGQWRDAQEGCFILPIGAASEALFEKVFGDLQIFIRLSTDEPSADEIRAAIDHATENAYKVANYVLTGVSARGFYATVEATRVYRVHPEATGVLLGLMWLHNECRTTQGDWEEVSEGRLTAGPPEKLLHGEDWSEILGWMRQEGFIGNDVGGSRSVDKRTIWKFLTEGDGDDE